MSCFAAWCCLPITTGQLWQYTFGQPGSCMVISCILFGISAVEIVLKMKIDAEAEARCGPYPGGSIPLTGDCATIQCQQELDRWSRGVQRWAVCTSEVEPALAQIASYASATVFAAVFFMTCQIRGAIRRRDNIPGACCGGGCCEDCLCSWFCACCTQSQLMRHVGMKGDRYNVCAPGGIV